MTKQFNRRDFFKFSALIHLSLFSQKHLPNFSLPNPKTDKKNIIILVFDAWSAYHTSIYGYERETMPNLVNWLDQAIIYHNHYSGSNKTTPGVSSLLTGTMPWTHRAIKNFDIPDQEFKSKNIFHLLNERKKIAYTHNPLADSILSLFSEDISKFKRHYELYLDGFNVRNIFKNDYDIASLNWSNIVIPQYGLSYSLMFEKIANILYNNMKNSLPENYINSFPLGLPSIFSDHYVLEETITWLLLEIEQTENPYLVYFHVLPPHWPYNTRKEFIDRFKGDGYHPILKPIHPYLKNTTSDHVLYEATAASRKLYDEYILYVDAELDRLLTEFKSTGVFDNSIVILTSDHGEMHERGLMGHGSQLLFEPLVKVPLIIWDPDQNERIDIHTPTSCIDLLPTLLKVNQLGIPNWLEGEILPPFSTSASLEQRSIYCYAGETLASKDITDGTIMIRKGDYKIIAYFNRIDKNEAQHNITYEVYNLSDDPEELINLYSTNPKIAQSLEDEVLVKLFEFIG